MTADVSAGPAINQFEVKDLESEAGSLAFETQSAFTSGQPRRKFVDTSGAGDFVFDDNTVFRQDHSLELQLGITDWFRVSAGIEYQQDRLDDPASIALANNFGALKLDELQLEGVVVLSKAKTEGVGLGLFVEYNHPISGEVESPGQLFVGPIVEAHTGPWSLTANVAFVKFIGGHAAPGDTEFVRDEKWDFNYSLQGKHKYSETLSLALEAYGTIDRLGNSGTRGESAQLFGDFNQHRIGPVAYFTLSPGEHASKAGARSLAKDDDDKGGGKGGGDKDGDDDKEMSVTIGAGALFGLNENTPDVTYKLSLEIEF